MRLPSFLIPSVIALLLIFYSANATASNSTIIDRNKAKVTTIEKLIRQHIALGRMKNSFFHPIIANKRSGPTRNPFANVSETTAAAMAKAGINLAALSRYKAIYFKGEYLGATSRKIINTRPDVILVVGDGTRLHDEIYSRGPVFVQGDVKDLSGIISSNIVWLSDKTKAPLPTYNALIGMPVVLRGHHANRQLITGSQAALNKIKQNRQSECQRYANNSIKQNTQNNTLRCGFKGSRWTNDRAGQFNWCMTMLSPVTSIEDDFRNKSLANCQAQKASPTNRKNRPAIPQACDDPGKQYRAVKSINHSFRYEKKIKSPVSNGMIRYDYNRDKSHDYVFLEVKDKKARVAVCLSRGRGYQRRVTDLEFSTEGYGTSGSEYWLTQNGDTLKLNINYFGHNEGSSGRNTSYRFQPNTGRFKIVSDNSDSSGVFQDGFEYPIFVPRTYRLF